MPNNLKSVQILMCYYKDLEAPLKLKTQHVVGLFLLEKSVFIMVFDDGVVWRLMNDKNKGIMDEHELKLNFKVVTHVMFDFNSQVILLQNEKDARHFFKFDGSQWLVHKLTISNKYQVLMFLGKFIVANYQDGYTFLIEMNKDEMGLHVQLGERDVWNYSIDADSRFSSFCLQFD